MAASIPDIMSLLEVRTPNEAGRAVLVLSDDLGRVLFANEAAQSIFGEADNTTSSLSDVPKSLRGLAPLLREDGEAMMRLKAKGGSLQLWVTAHAFTTKGPSDEPIVLLSAPMPLAEREAPSELAARLLREAAASDTAVLTAGGRLVRVGADFTAADDFSEDGEPAVTGFVESGLPRETNAGRTLWRVASDLVLLRQERAVAAPEEPEQRLGLGAIVSRWRSRDERATDPGAEPLPAAPSDPAEITPPSPAAAALPTGALASAALGGEPVRFVWQIDAKGRFRQLSPEFAGVVGAGAADVLGIAFSDVAEAFAFDEDGEIGGLLERRETWSGRSIHWPVEGTDRKVLVDLAALPTYTRDRVFDGFRGFGVVRPAENILDPEAIGLSLSGAAAPAQGLEAPVQPLVAEVEPTADDAPAFGRRARPPGESAERDIINLEERRRRETLLSPAEEDAFRAIGKELSPLSRIADRVKAAIAIDAAATAILAAVPAPLLVEAQGRLVFANGAFLQLSGYAGLEDLVASGGLDALFVDIDEDARLPETVRLRKADGAMIDARVQMQRARLSDQSCLVFSFAPLAAGIEDLSEHVEALEEEMVELRSILDTATDGILILDPAGSVRSMNGSAQSLLGLSGGSYEGRPFTEFLAEDSRGTADDYLASLRSAGFGRILNDGREVLAEVAGRGVIPLFLTIGRLADDRGWCVLLRDIAPWKRAEEELVAARRQAEDASLTKSRFLANISHELRTPLNAIIGFADVMAAETYGPIGHERYLEYLRDIKRSGHHVLDLVNDLLDISKIEAGKVELSFEAVSLNEVVGEVVSLMQPQANRQRVLVRSNLPTGVPEVVADRRTLRQIALNLVANAIRFTPAGGQIIASTGLGENGEVLLRFRDSGIGMTDREIEIALTPFQQVNASKGERGDGTGLGLPLTKAMVEANRALFHIASTPGEGTLIEITFPPQRVLTH